MSVRLSYADINNNGTIEPASEILEENNYYPFGLKHQGYNELAGDKHKYKFLNKEYQPELGLNVTAMDFRHYDAALGRFNNMDALSELAPSQTPYRYGFNNPVYWTDPTGLFETYAQAVSFLNRNNVNGEIRYLNGIDASEGYVVEVIGGEFDGQVFYDYHSALVFSNERPSSGGGGSSSGSSGSPAGNGPGGPSSGAAPGAPAGFSGAGPGGVPGGTSIFQGQGSTPAERFWNSPMMRLTIPDKISFGIAGEWAYFVGIDVNTFNFTVLTRGEAGIYYTPNINVRAGIGSYVSGGVNFSTGLFTGNPSNITASMLQGSTYGVMATGAYIGEASVGVSYSPTREASQGFINMNVGVGLGAGPAGGAGGFFGAQYQYTPAYGTIWKWY